MRNVRNALLVVLALAGTAALATDTNTNCGIEVLRVSGIEVLMVDTHSWGAPPGSTVHAVADLGAGPVTLSIAPVDPLTGHAMVVFPFNHPSNRVELRDPAGVVLDVAPALQWD